MVTPRQVPLNPAMWYPPGDPIGGSPSPVTLTPGRPSVSTRYSAMVVRKPEAWRSARNTVVFVAGLLRLCVKLFRSSMTIAGSGGGAGVAGGGIW